MDPGDFERVNFAYIVSKFGHAKQIRDDGTRYFDHPKSAAWIYIDELGGRDPRAIIDLLLHDLAEDTYLLSSYRLAINFGEDIALDIRALTKLPKGKETTTQYLGRVVDRGAWAIIGKLCDRLHNLRTLGAAKKDKIAAQIEETEKYHLPILIPALKECGKPWKAYAIELEKELLTELAILKKNL